MAARTQMTPLSLTIFLATYAGVAIGRVPGLALDRTGIALLGAIAMIISGVIPLDTAVDAVHAPTILLLYALMVLSAQLRLGGFYTWLALQLGKMPQRPGRFLLITMLVSAGLSAVLSNDIICLAFTPVLALTLLRSGLNPVPFLIGLAVASNIGSAATLIGNPQNMLIGQVGRLPFDGFLAWCAPPALLGLLLGFGWILRAYRGKFRGPTYGYSAEPAKDQWPDFNRYQSGKGILAVGMLILFFLTPVPREYAAIGIAGVLLCSRRMRSRHILGLVDWHLLTLFCALFIVIQGVVEANLPERLIDALYHRGIHLRSLPMLAGVSAVMSNVVSNVPAAMLLIRFLDPGNPVEWYTLAVSSTFAGNLVVIGSIANLIVVEQARTCGVEITFREHARVGIPVTLLSLLALVAWIYV